MTPSSARSAAANTAVRAASRGDLYVERKVADLLIAHPHVTAFGSDLKVESFALTCREVEIWVLLAAGGSNEDIADRMDLSTRTVRFHLSNLFRKIRVQKRGEAIALAYRTAGLPTRELAFEPGPLVQDRQ
jgi:DNA-binding NarL/FixJ family response regulator